MEKEKKLTEVVKNSTILAQHRKRKEREDSSRRETVTVFCCGCDCTIACDKLQESDWDKEDHSHCKYNLLSIQFPHGPHKLGPEHKPWPDSTAYRAAPGNRPGASMGMAEKTDPGSQNCFQSCSRGLPRPSIKTTKTSQFYAGLWEFLQLANSFRDFEDFLLCIHFQVRKRSIHTTGWKQISPNRGGGSLVNTISQAVTSAWDTQTFMHQLQDLLYPLKNPAFLIPQ